MQLADIDLLDRDRFTEGIPHEWFTLLRAKRPVYKHAEPDGPGFWVITKHADIVPCNRDGGDVLVGQARGGVVGLEERASRDRASSRRQPHAHMDPPDHTRSASWSTGASRRA